MALNVPQAAAPLNDESNNRGTAKWIAVEVKGMLHTLNDKDTHISGNGFKLRGYAGNQGHIATPWLDVFPSVLYLCLKQCTGTAVEQLAKAHRSPVGDLRRGVPVATHALNAGVSAAVHTDIQQLKKIFDEYLFVQKYSGTGWDDVAKHATNTAEYVEDFAKTHGKKYAKCFKDPCPCYTELRHSTSPGNPRVMTG
ncbi:hypothetical protein B0H17DRAFT_1142203 [Mycena rosella]|uniref:Uncharacterized protein n=1 Tax=Mycena rosella TaxID=1033263 RepID=A0AAD7CYA7_MYCRO|nr:hypothetical protein B0H17DRAFT_1142203 [Mycena rosella]